MSGACMPLGRRTKYNAIGSHDEAGRWFPSRLERARFGQLRLMEHAGLIRDLRHQVVVELAGCVSYRADFAYIETVPNRLVHEDAKGVQDKRFQVVTQLWRLWGPTPLLVTGTGGRLLREILPQPQRRVAWLRAELARLEGGG